MRRAASLSGPHARAGAVVLVAVGLVLVACSNEPAFGGSGVGGSTSASTPTSGGPGSGGESSAPSSGSASDGGGGAASAISASSATTTSVTTGAECAVPGDCIDGDPCTDDTCLDRGVCASSAKAPGLPGNPGEGACVGVCQSDGSCGQRVFSRPFFEIGGEAGAWEVQTLSELWGTRGAPPLRDVVAVEHLAPIDYLLVFTAQGMVHIRDFLGVWQPGVVASTVFPGLPSGVVGSYSFQPTDGGPMSLTIATWSNNRDLQRAYLYEVTDRGAVTADPGNPFPIDRTDEAGSPPAPSELIRWSFGVQTSFPPTPSWVVLWEQSGGRVYSLDGGSLVWTDHGEAASSPIWQGMGAAPPSNGVVAAWFDGSDIHLIAP